MVKTKRKKASNKERLSVVTAIILVFLVVYTVFLISLMIWTILTTLKTRADFRLNIIGFPQEFAWDNFPTVLSEFYVEVTTSEGTQYMGVPILALNSILYSVGCALVSTLVPCLTAYTCARFSYRFSKIVYTIVIVTMVIPIVGTQPVQIRLMRDLNLYDTMFGMWLMQGHFLGMYFLVFYNTFRALPMAYTEAAKIDGASNFMVLVKIILPMMKNTIFTVFLIRFIFYWNEYTTTLLFLPTHPTLALGMYNLLHMPSDVLSGVPMRLAGAVMLLIPTLILYLCCHKRLMGNLRMGGLKG